MAHSREPRIQQRCSTAATTLDGPGGTEQGQPGRSPSHRDDGHSWNAVFRRFRDELDVLRHQAGSPGGPTELALTVIAEAMAIGEVLTADTPHQDSTGRPGFAPNGGEPTNAVFDGVDTRYLDHRARALRAALQYVDDYVWWGGLRARALADPLP